MRVPERTEHSRHVRERFETELRPPPGEDVRGATLPHLWLALTREPQHEGGHLSVAPQVADMLHGGGVELSRASVERIITCLRAALDAEIKP